MYTGSSHLQDSSIRCKEVSVHFACMVPYARCVVYCAYCTFNFASVKATHWLSHGPCFVFFCSSWEYLGGKLHLGLCWRWVLLLEEISSISTKCLILFPFAVNKQLYCVSSRSTVAIAMVWLSQLPSSWIFLLVVGQKESARHFVQSKGDLTCASLCWS